MRIGGLSRAVQLVCITALVAGSVHVAPAPQAGAPSSSDSAKGYRLVAADGGIFAFDATHHGSTGATPLNQPIVGMAAPPSAETAPRPTTTTTTAATATVLAAGDIADCDASGDEQTAVLLDRAAGEILALGDTVYENGTAAEFASCYEPTWGRHRARTHPAPGNHEYNTPGAAGYFDYFGAAAGPARRGWYSFDLGAWHVVSLNSEDCDGDDGCAVGSPQIEWLQADLAAHPALCTLAFWHQPRFSSGRQQAGVDPLWRTLHAAGADVVLTGHEHSYERFAPLSIDGNVDHADGIRSFVVGTGGRYLRDLPSPRRTGSEVGNDDTFGVLRLTLRAAGFDWKFLPVDGHVFTDSGSASCR